MRIIEILKTWSELLQGNVSKMRTRLAPLYSFRNLGVGFVGAVATIGTAAAVISASGGGKGHGAPRADNGSAIAAMPVVAADHRSDAILRPGSQSFAAASGNSAGFASGGALMLDSEGGSTNSSSLNGGAPAYGIISPDLPAPVLANAAGNGVFGIGSSSISNSGYCCSASTSVTQSSNVAALSLTGSGAAALSLSAGGSRLILSSKHVPGVPEPSVAWLGTLGLVLVGARVLKLRKSASATRQD